MSRTTSAAIAVFAASTMLAASVQAGAFRTHRQIPSWYFSLGGSVNYVDDTDFSETSSGVRNTGEGTFDEGVGLFGSIGYRPRYTNSFWDNSRFELEVAMASNDAATFSAGLPALSGDVESERVMVNMLMDLDTGTPIRPYVGGGVGAARISLDGGEDSVLAYQALAGLTYTPSSFPLLEFSLGYRYFEAPDVDVTSGTTGGTLGFDYSTHSLEAALRAYF